MSGYRTNSDLQIMNLQRQMEKHQLENNVNSALSIMKKDKQSLKNVKTLLDEYQQNRVHQSYQDGIRGTNDARRRVREHYQDAMEKEESDIDNLIKKQTDAIHATNLERLLTKKWSEYPNSFHIMSKIRKFSKNEDRVNKLMNWDRYSP